MAGSYGHITDDAGRFIGTDGIDNLGDAYEALEECYGMIQFLSGGTKGIIEEARRQSDEGLRIGGAPRWAGWTEGYDKDESSD